MESFTISNMQITDPTLIPDQIKAVCGKTFQFLICIGGDNLSGANDSYKVANVWEDNKFMEISNEASENTIDRISLTSEQEMDQISLKSLTLKQRFCKVCVSSTYPSEDNNTISKFRDLDNTSDQEENSELEDFESDDSEAEYEQQVFDCSSQEDEPHDPSDAIESDSDSEPITQTIEDKHKEAKCHRDGYPIYRRRDDGRFIEKNGFKCDNTYVVPYNRKLSLKYRAHINVEWCNQTGSVKYLFKYVHKGQDRVTVSVEAGQEEDETEYTSDGVNINSSKKKDDVQDFFDCRYVSACEAFWRTNQYPIHYRATPVVKLTFHEEGKQPVFYKDGDKPTTVLNRPTLDHTMFTAWFELCLRDEEARKLTYEQIPNKYIYDKKEKEFRPRGRTGFSIGRINYVPHNLEDSYHLRILINSKKGPTSFNDIKTVKGVLYKTYKEACFALGLLDDDKEYIEGIKEANFWCSSKFCRRLFVIMLISESLTSPKTVWEETWKILSEDIERKEKQRRQRPDTEKKKLLLRELQKLMKRNGCSLQKYKLMPHISLEDVTLPNQLILDELNYNREDLAKKHDGWKKMLTEEQKKIYDEIMEAVINDKGGVFFLYGFGGTGKTFLWKVLSAAIRSNGHIVLNSASSGIASLLLEGGRTAHSRFALPLNPNETSTCNMSRSSELGALVKEAKLIIWDEAPMMSKYCFETLDRSLKDIMRSKEDKLFGGKVVLFGGDFRQILPVIVGAGREAIVNASLNSSYLWNQCKVLRLTKNMRLLQDIGKQEASEIEEFSKWILAVGEGKINEPNDGVCEIDIPQELLIPEGSSPLESIIEAVYGKNFATQKDPKFFQERAILCPTNEDVNSINDVMLSSLNG
ncbi:PREDICTED: uncharacterized protein LOC109129103 [Camelina sativa]|uniref:ATP-dependent DNA helicase n=1 Tax=Camelina sativa TaxID=90675 RepID=A0ABM1QZT7_CAMSA|nr:PREDICTED: uncharacterized protein LOC109129103 [Camelina sativa]